MAHVHTDPGHHDATASALIILRTPDDEPRIWLHKHRKLGLWLQFGGHVELHETPWQAVQHEIREESGYDISQLKLLQPKLRIKHLTDAVLHPQPIMENTHRFRAGEEHFHTDRIYAFVTSQQPAHAIDEGESGDFVAMTLAEIMALPADTIPQNTKEMCVFLLEQILPNYEAVDPALFN